MRLPARSTKAGTSMSPAPAPAPGREIVFTWGMSPACHGRVLGALFGIAIAFGASPAAAQRDTTLYFDDPRANVEGELHFKERERIEPDRSDFRIVDYTTMSNDFGERWALVTVRNSSSGDRLLKDRQIVATLASGQRVYAQNLDERVDGLEMYTQAVYFGIHKFPIVRLEMRP